MSFPQTRMTLIERLASGGSEEDWGCFLKDYRGPVCRFALRWGARDLDEAEELASQTFLILLENRLLTRWVSNRSAKLRSLLCRVVRNLLANRNRVQAGRERHASDLARHVEGLHESSDDSGDAFYAAWVADLVQRSVESLVAQCHAKSKGDVGRVLYGRLCRRQTNAQVAEFLEITPSAADHQYREAKRRLADTLESLVRSQVERYCPAEDVDDEFALEWQQLGRYLASNGGLEAAVQDAYDQLNPVIAKKSATRLAQTQERLSQVLRKASLEAPGSDQG